MSVWGFKQIERVVHFEMCATSSGIDWNVAPDEQPLETRPPAPPETVAVGGPSPRTR